MIISLIYWVSDELNLEPEFEFKIQNT